MVKRLNSKQRAKLSFTRALFDGFLPVDMVLAGSELALVRPGILSGRAMREEGLNIKEEGSENEQTSQTR